MKYKKVKYALILMISILFVISIQIYYLTNWDYDRFSIDYSNYNNIANYEKFLNEIYSNLGVENNNIYMINGGTLEVDSNGNVIALNFEGVYKEKEDIYVIKCHLDGNLCYELTRSDSVLSDIPYNSIDLYECLHNLNKINVLLSADKNNIIIESNFLTNIKYSNNYESYVILENDFNKVEKDIVGEYWVISLIDENLKRIYIECS